MIIDKIYRKNRELFILIFLFTNFVTVQAQTSEILTKAQIDGKYFKSYLTDTKNIIISPTRWTGKKWITAGAVIGGTVLLYQYDKDIQEYFQARQTPLGKDISKHVFEPMGSGVYSLPAMALFYGQGLIWKNERSKKVALMGIKAYLLSGFLVTFSKILFNRHRPYHDNPANPQIWEGPSLPLYKSFPSGHTTTVFAIAAVVATEYKETIWVPIVSYSLTGLAGISRMYYNKHWSSDVFFAAAFGWSIGKLIQASSKWKIQTAPMVTPESAGLFLNYKF